MSKTDNKETLQRLKAIAAKRAGEVTAEDMAYISELSDDLAVPFNPKTTRCRSCYTDQAVVLYSHLHSDEDESATDGEKSGRAYVLRKGLDVYFGSMRVNAATIDTDEKAERLLQMGFARKFFDKLPGE